MYTPSGEKVVARALREERSDEVLFLTGAEWSRWQAPAVEKTLPPLTPQAAANPTREAAPDRTLNQALERMREQAYREGYEQGLREGRAAGAAHIEAQRQQWQSLLHALSRPLEQLDEEVTHQLVLLTSAIASAVVQNEVTVNPLQVVDVVRRAVAVMPAESRNVSVHVHPEDAKLLREAFHGSGDQHWKIVDDPEIGRGGCEVHSDTSRIDERLETRLARVVEEVMGGVDASGSERRG